MRSACEAEMEGYTRHRDHSVFASRPPFVIAERGCTAQHGKKKAKIGTTEQTLVSTFLEYDCRSGILDMQRD